MLNNTNPYFTGTAFSNKINTPNIINNTQFQQEGKKPKHFESCFCILYWHQCSDGYILCIKGICYGDEVWNRGKEKIQGRKTETTRHSEEKHEEANKQEEKERVCILTMRGKKEGVH